MAAVKGWVVDRSALVRLGKATDTARWLDRLNRGLLHVATVTLLETGWSARSGKDLRSALREPPLSLMPHLLAPPRAELRALEVQLLLADAGHHRGPGPSDLLLAASAELEGLTVLHVDRDYEMVSAITGQSVERLVTAASDDGPG